MSDQASKLFDQAMQLSEADRGDLAALLLESIEPESEEEVAAAWEAEIRQRVKNIDEGKVKMIPEAEFHRRVQETLDAISRD